MQELLNLKFTQFQQFNIYLCFIHLSIFNRKNLINLILNLITLFI
jgi:hypothetical protein